VAPAEEDAVIPFVKGHGLGNDYIVINEADLAGPLSTRQIERICDRNWGAGSDGILLLVPAWGGADFGLRILNPDGSEAEKSGNGLRIFAKYLWDHGHAKHESFTVATKGGRVECRCHVERDRVNLVTVELGRCTFLAPEIPMNGPAREAVGVPLQVEGETLLVTAVSVGNPHCVIFTDRLDEARVRRLGPLVEHHPAFPNRINVQWARVASRSEVDILIWERGAGYTLASGSSSSAVACAAVRNGLCDHGLVTVRMPGGTLSIEVRPDWSIRLQGPVEEVYTGTFSRDLMDALHALSR
jgi:diaminopimelate epimerase